MDGKQYPLPYYADVTPNDQRVILRHQPIWEKAFGGSRDQDLDPETERQALAATNEIFARVMKDSSELHERLTFSQKQTVIGTFFSDKSRAETAPTK